MYVKVAQLSMLERKCNGDVRSFNSMLVLEMFVRSMRALAVGKISFVCTACVFAVLCGGR